MLMGLFTVLGQILPLYSLAFLGFFLGKYSKIKLKSLSSLSIYFLSPLIFTISLSQSRYNLELLFLPLSTYTLASALAWTVFYFIILRRKTRSFMAEM